MLVLRRPMLEGMVGERLHVGVHGSTHAKFVISYGRHSLRRSAISYSELSSLTPSTPEANAALEHIPVLDELGARSVAVRWEPVLAEAAKVAKVHYFVYVAKLETRDGRAVLYTPCGIATSGELKADLVAETAEFPSRRSPEQLEELVDGLTPGTDYLVRAPRTQSTRACQLTPLLPSAVLEPPACHR